MPVVDQETFETLIKQVTPEAIATRHHLHQNPELSHQEQATSELVAQKLRALGLDEVRTGVGGYGVVGWLARHGEQNRKRPDNRPPRRYGRAANSGTGRAALQILQTRRDACLRPRWTYRHPARRGVRPCPTPRQNSRHDSIYLSAGGRDGRRRDGDVRGRRDGWG